MNMDKIIVRKGESRLNLKYQQISVSKELVKKIQEKYPNINLNKTTENLLKEMLK